MAEAWEWALVVEWVPVVECATDRQLSLSLSPAKGEGDVPSPFVFDFLDVIRYL